ncbi:hypothetical protein [Reticulibacter mediterranei]|uniref:hypothetical protein n=1 Tax=Reticulibacter mediterranei TaxID=2778369 RepID=UPI001C68DEA0|nr:hypothetical protein [Reticulibacter mediterranei]
MDSQVVVERLIAGNHITGRPRDQSLDYDSVKLQSHVGKTTGYGRGDGLSSPNVAPHRAYGGGRGQAVAPAISDHTPEDVLDASTNEA